MYFHDYKLLALAGSPLRRSSSSPVGFPASPPVSSNIFLSLVDIDAQFPQVGLGQLDLAHQLLVGGGYVVEGHDVPAESEEEVGAEGDEGPEGKLKKWAASEPRGSAQNTHL